MMTIYSGNQDEPQKPNPLEIRLEDHLYFQQKEVIVHPSVPEFWNEAYLKSVADFIVNNKKPGETGTVDHPHSILILETDWMEKNNPEPLNRMHLEEAYVRGTTPWVLENVLFMQKNLLETGVITGDDLVGQRDEIFKFLEEKIKTGLNPKKLEEYENIGKLICALTLCTKEYWILKDISLDKADELLGGIAEKYGTDLYHTRILHWLGMNTRDTDLYHETDIKMAGIFSSSRKETDNFIQTLDQPTRKAYKSVVRNTSSTMAKRIIRNSKDSKET